MLEGFCHIQLLSDLSIQEDIERLASEVTELNGFLNSGGIPKICPIKRIDRKTIEEIMNVNTTGPILLFSQLLKKKIYKRTLHCFDSIHVRRLHLVILVKRRYGATKAALSVLPKPLL